jgi:hypothetical protein
VPIPLTRLDSTSADIFDTTDRQRFRKEDLEPSRWNPTLPPKGTKQATTTTTTAKNQTTMEKGKKPPPRSTQPRPKSTTNSEISKSKKIPLGTITMEPNTSPKGKQKAKTTTSTEKK